MNQHQAQFLAIAGVICFICLIIAFKSYDSRHFNRLFRSKPPDPAVRRFLFQEANIIQIAISNVGAGFSFYIVVFAAIMCSFVWGSLMVLMAVFSIAAGCLTISVLILRVLQHWKKGEYQTYLDLLPSTSGKVKASAIFYMLIFTFFTILSELQVIQDLFHITGVSSQTLISEPISSFSTAFSLPNFLIILCILYVIRGGYRGVLWTDIFQFLIILSFAICVIYWILQYQHSFSELLTSHFVIDISSVSVSLGISLAVFVWITSSLDIWVRTAGSLAHDTLQIHKIRVISAMALSAVIALALVGPALYAGLVLRDFVLTDATVATPMHSTSNRLTDARYQTETAEEVNKLSQRIGLNDYVESHLPKGLSTRVFFLDALQGSAAAFEDRTEFYKSFFVFSAFANEKMPEHSFIMYIVTIVSFLAAAICVTLTTIDSFVLAISQATYRFVESFSSKYGDRPLSFCSTGHSRFPSSRAFLQAWYHPKFTIGVFVLLIVFFSSTSGVLSSMFTGAFAWSSMIFLTMISFSSILFFGRDDDFSPLQPISNSVFVGFVAWCIFVATPCAYILLLSPKEFSELLSEMPVGVRAYLGAVGGTSALLIWALVFGASGFLYGVVRTLVAARVARSRLEESESGPGRV